MTAILVIDEATEDRLHRTLREALPGKVLRLPVEAIAEAGLTEAEEDWRLCVGPELGRRIKSQGLLNRLIFALTREEFTRRSPPLGPRDSLLFHDVAPARLPLAIRLALVGLTLFPPELVPEDEMAGPVLAGFDQLTEEDRLVMVELASGGSTGHIARRLGRSPERVRLSVDRIYRKLGCPNRTEVAVLAWGRFSTFLDLRQETVSAATRQPSGRT